MQSLIRHITRYAPLSEQAVEALELDFEKQVLPKNEYLLTEGKICQQLYFIEKGAARGFYYAADKEITHWFGFENAFITSLYSFITRKPSVENIQLLEGSVLWCISKDSLTRLCNLYPDIERVLRMTYETYYIRLEERFINTQFKTAAERYELLLQQAPHILERVQLGYIASYLGISQETLSRIRSRI